MGSNKHKEIKQVTLSAEQAADLQARLEANQLTRRDRELLLSLIKFNLWLQERLSRAKLTIKRLRQLFGFKSESKKKGNKSEKNENTSDASSESELDSSTEDDQSKTLDDSAQDKALLPAAQWDPQKNHGRYAANDYQGCPITEIVFQDPLLKANKCPQCEDHDTDANLLPEDPSVIVFLESQPLITGRRYALEKARCSVCQSYFTAELPDELKRRPKYSNTCTTSLSIAHYYAGLPFKRIETLQQLQKVPMADATQYDLVNQFYTSTVSHVVNAMRQLAANATDFSFDDTPGHITEQILKNKQGKSSRDKKSVHTTAMLCEHEGHRIYLYDTNTRVAGKQFSKLLEERKTQETFKTMTDALPSNFPMLADNLLARWVITLCLSHGRRRFYELLEDEDKDVRLVLDIIAKVYRNEKQCKQKKLNPKDRLAYHKTHSGPLMESLRTWLNNLLLYKLIESNSRLGEAITYMLKRWHWLTQFLRVPGARLDNNLCEQAIKVAIRYRKNSLFYKTFYGARIGDAMMSLFQTAAHANVNLYEYCNTLQEYTQDVQQYPERWLPWNYQDRVSALEAFVSDIKMAA